MILIEGIDVRNVARVDDKIENAMHRLSNLKKWRCEIKLHSIKDRMIEKARSQLDFLLRVNKAKLPKGYERLRERDGG